MQNIILFKAEEDSADKQKTMIYSEKFWNMVFFFYMQRGTKLVIKNH